MSLLEVIESVHNWSNFKKAIISLGDKAKGDAFELLVKYFFQLDPQYKTKIKHIWLLQEVPHKIKEHLSLPEPDKGIDLIAETNNKEYWAIQCKYRDDELKTITWKEISTFTGLAFGVCKNISFGIVCSTTERLTKVLRHQDKISFCSSEVWRSLDDKFFDDLRNLLKGKHVLPEKFLPRSHQIRAIKNAVKHFVNENNTRGKMIMPCGSGKSLTAFWIAENLNAQKILVAVPSLALIKQSLRIWLKEVAARDIYADWICVASDETVSEIKDDAVILKQDLGIPALTDESVIKNWLDTKSEGLKIVFTTYQSGKIVSKAAKDIGFHFDIGIMDEAHKTVGSRNKLFSHLLFEENISIRKRLFMTATERRYVGNKDEIISMDDVSIYGDTFELLTFKEAINNEPPILSDYKIITLLVTNDEIKKYITDNLLLKLDKTKIEEEITSQQFASLIALRKAIQKYPIKHAISFHNSIRKAKSFQWHHELFNEEHKEFYKLNSFHVSGNMPTSVRDNIIRNFEIYEPSLITNVRCLTEGVDVPGIDCVLFTEPRKSTIDIVQAVGRALRIKEGKEYGYVLLPIVVEEEKLSDGFENSKAFKSILSVLRSLASNDERIIEYFRGKHSVNTYDRNILIEVDEKISKTINYNDFLNKLELKVWDKLAKLSWKPFEEARIFIHELGLKSQTEWFKYTKRQLPNYLKKPLDIPANPNIVYKNNGWTNWGSWLGTYSIQTQQRKYWNYDKAKIFVNKLTLKNYTEWSKYCKGLIPGLEKKPNEIPNAPHMRYKNEGWISWGDFLGTNTIADNLKSFKSFEEARVFARKLGLKSSTEWRKYVKRKLQNHCIKPNDIPSSPDKVYEEKGWTNWGDFLGTSNVASFLQKYRDFQNARDFVRTLNLKSTKEWFLYTKGKIRNLDKKPKDKPTNPRAVYKNQGWVSMGDWLGCGNTATFFNEYRGFNDAREFVRKLHLSSQQEWKKYIKNEVKHLPVKPKDIPNDPRVVYKNKGWISLGDWLGTGKVATHLFKYRDFESAKEFAIKLRLRSSKEWKEYVGGEYSNLISKPNDIPNKPDQTYKNKGWKNWGDFLGTGTVAHYKKEYRNFESAREYVRVLGLKSGNEWKKYCKNELNKLPPKPNDIPANPNRTYKNNGWISMGDWLGTGTIAPFLIKYKKFSEARKFVRKLKLKNQSDWRNYIKKKYKSLPPKPHDIPSNPMMVYKDKGWISLGDWLGTGTVATFLIKYRMYEEAKEFVKKLEIKSGAEWKKYVRGKLKNKVIKPKDIPAKPDWVYRNQGWKGWKDWLGINEKNS